LERRPNSAEASLSTNGSRSNVIKDLIENGLLNHIAIDVKAPLEDPEKYMKATGINRSRIIDIIKEVRNSIDLSMNVPLIEFRTTMIPNFLLKSDIIQIAKEIKEKLIDSSNVAYVIQQFVPSKTLIDKNYFKIPRTPLNLLIDTARTIKIQIKLENIYVRTLDFRIIKI